jgi:hypothetical protein
MKRAILSLSLLLAFTATPASTSIKGPDARKLVQGPVYDTATVIDVMATVVDTWEVRKPDRLDGIYVTVQMSSGMLDVYLGPADFVRMFGVIFARGDKVELIGSRVMTENGEIVLAAEVYSRDATLILRDKDGTPYWTNWGKRPKG